MNKQSTIIIIILLVLGLLGIYMLVSNKQEDTNMGSDQIAQENMQEEQEINLLDPINFLPETPEMAIKYELTDASVSYTAQKRFLSKADEEIVGTTNEVKGLGWLDEETGSFAVAAHLDFATIASPSKQRDEDILKLFNDTNVLILAQVDEEDGLIMGEEVTLQVPILLTINGMQRSEVFDVTVTVNENEVTASGQTSILMSDFGVNPPSLLEVFTVDDEIVISFEVNGTTTSEEAAVEEEMAEEEMIEEEMAEEETMEEEEPVTEEETIVEEE